jgi:DNA-binding response OmpR family regulator
MSGPELARQLRARWPALSVLFMSGYSTEDLRHQGALGSEEITIAKPFNLDSLVRSVTAALSSNHSQRSHRS